MAPIQLDRSCSIHKWVQYKLKVAPIQLDRSCSIHKWVVHKGEIQEKSSPRQQPILHNSTNSTFQSLGLNIRQSNNKKKKEKKKKRKARKEAKEKVEAIS